MIETNDTSNTKHKTLRLWVVAFFIIVTFGLGVYLRVVAMNEPLWLDELHTSWCVNGSLAEVFQRARLGNQSPLFFYVDYLSVSIFGHSKIGYTEIALRLPSLIASIMLLVSVPWIVFRLSGSLVGALLAMSLSAIDDNFLFYSVEARPYAMVQLVAVWQVCFFLRCLMFESEGGSSQARSRALCVAIWVPLTVVLFYLHFTTISLIAVELFCLWGIWLDETRRKDIVSTKSSHRIKPIVLASSVAVLLMLPGILMLLQIGQHRTDWNSMVSPERYGLMMVAHLVAYLLPVLVIGFALRGSSIDRGACGLFVVLGLLVALPIVFSFIGSVTQIAPLGHYRFSIASSTIMVVLAGVAFRILNSRRRKVLTLVLTVGLAIATNPLFEPTIISGNIPQQRHENWRKASELISRSPDSSDPIVLCSNLVEDVRFSDSLDESFQSYLKFPLAGIYCPDSMLDRQILSAAILDQAIRLPESEHEKLRKQNAFWFLIRANPEQAEALASDFRDEMNRNEVVSWRFERSAKLKVGPLSLFRFVRGE